VYFGGQCLGRTKKVGFSLSLRNADNLMFERGIDVCHEIVMFCWNRFGPIFEVDIRGQWVSRMRDSTHWRWHVDVVFVKINSETHYLWCAVDHEGEILESYVTKKRDKSAALRFFKKAMKRHGRPVVIVTDGLRSHRAAMVDLGCERRREMGRLLNNRVESSHLPVRRRECVTQRSRRVAELCGLSWGEGGLAPDFANRKRVVIRLRAPWCDILIDNPVTPVLGMLLMKGDGQISC